MADRPGEERGREVVAKVIPEATPLGEAWAEFQFERAEMKRKVALEVEARLAEKLGRIKRGVAALADKEGVGKASIARTVGVSMTTLYRWIKEVKEESD